MGDVFKVGACVVVNVLVAKAQVRSFIKLQIIFTISYVLLSVSFFDLWSYWPYNSIFCKLCNLFLCRLTIFLLLFEESLINEKYEA